MSIRSILDEKVAGMTITDTNCVEVATELASHLLSVYPNIMGAVPVIKSGVGNGNAFQNSLTVTDIDGVVHKYTHHAVLIAERRVYDFGHGYIGVPFNEYLKKAILSGTEYFRFDMVLTHDVPYCESLLDDEVCRRYRPRYSFNTVGPSGKSFNTIQFGGVSK